MRLAWALPLLAACVTPARADDPPAPNPLVPMIERYSVDLRALERLHSTPLSAGRRDRLRVLHQAALKDVDALDLGPLPVDARIDAALFANHLRHQVSELEREAVLDAEIAPLVPFAGAIVALEDARREMKDVDAPRAAGTLTELAKAVKEARKGVDEKKTSRTLARRASKRVDALQEALGRWHRFHAGYHPEYTWWCAKPYAEADRELEEYQTFLAEKVARLKAEGPEGLVGDPLGREALLRELAYERIAYGPEELLAAAERQFAWCEERLKEASREMGFDDWAKALEKVKTAHVPPGKQPALIRDLAREAEELMEKKDLLTVPPLAKEVWRMEMMSPERQKSTPYFTGGEVISVSFPTSDMPHDLKMMVMRGNNIHFARATVQHELIPGHHLQIFMAERHRTHRRLFRTAFLVEGWCLYWEMRLWDLGFARGPEDRIGMLFWRMHRAARIITTLKFHLGQMPPAEMVDFLVKRVGHEPSGAEAEVRRYIGGDYGPLYQVAYMMGGLQLLALHKELVGSGRLTERAFHDAVLRENSIPIDLIRAGLTGAAPTPSASWKFLD
ncbi:MAG TPA: DUF885 family protein [Planctomycetota bacterium]